MDYVDLRDNITIYERRKILEYYADDIQEQNKQMEAASKKKIRR